MITPLGYASVGLYALSLALYVLHLYENKLAAGRAASAFLAVGLVTHYFALLERAHAVHAVPYQDLYGSMSLFGWFLALTYLALELRHGQRTVGAFVLPVVLLLYALATILSPAAPAPAPARGSLFAFHVTVNILAYSAFTLSFVFSCMYLVQNRLLRDRHLGAMGWRMPSLELLEGMTRSGVRVGLVALVIGATLGFAVVNRLRGHFFTFDPKEIITLLILAGYAVYLWLEGSAGWRGARASKLCALTYLAVVFSYTVVNLFLSQYHHFY
jgi:ABC-type uncharacterized transport system permease subunit